MPRALFRFPKLRIITIKITNVKHSRIIEFARNRSFSVFTKRYKDY